MVSVEVVVMVVAMVVMGLAAEAAGVQQLEMGMAMTVTMEKALENRRKCSNHATLGNTR